MNFLLFTITPPPPAYFQYGATITPGNEQHVHHILVYTCPGDLTSLLGSEYHCHTRDEPRLAGDCTAIMIAWAIGGGVSLWVGGWVGVGVGVGMWVSVCTYLCVCVSTYVCLFVCVCVLACMRVCVHECVSVCGA
jgi:hypothetical protein